MQRIREKLDQAQRELTVAEELEGAAATLRYRANEHRKNAVTFLQDAGEVPAPATDTIRIGPAS